MSAIGESIYHFQWESDDPIKSVHLIPHHHIQIDSAERYYMERKDFNIIEFKQHHWAQCIIQHNDVEHHTNKILLHKSGHEEST